MGGLVLNPRTVAIALGLAALAFLVFGGLLRRGHDTAQRHLALLFGVAVLPGIALVAGTGAALREAERPTFCGSCHVMQPWYRDVTDPTSKNLAAVHYQNRFILEDQCYTCHTDYAMFGPVRSKLAGLRHLWHWALDDFERPITPYGGYNFGNCLHCHGEAKNYREQHEAVEEQLADGSMNCLDCHAPVHPKQPEEK